MVDDKKLSSFIERHNRTLLLSVISLALTGTFTSLYLIKLTTSWKPSRAKRTSRAKTPPVEKGRDEKVDEDRNFEGVRKSVRKKRLKFGPHVTEYPEQKRFHMQVSIGLQRKIAIWEALNNKCDKCWVMKTHCICAQMGPLALPVDFVVLMYYKEYLRSTNTGHLLTMNHEKSKLMVAGRPEDEDILAGFDSIVEKDPYSIVVLMPCENAISVDEFIKRRSDLQSKSRLTVVLLDGTWRQASKGLNKSISEKVIRVKLDVQNRESVFKLRNRTREDGICTIEAAAMFLEDLNAGQSVLDSILGQLEVLNQAVLASTVKRLKFCGKKNKDMNLEQDTGQSIKSQSTETNIQDTGKSTVENHFEDVPGDLFKDEEMWFKGLELQD